MEVGGQLHAVDALPTVITGWVLDATEKCLAARSHTD
jgi:hypothetical protein